MKNKILKENLSDASQSSEFRLNYLKNFNHLTKDQLGAMEIFGPRTNNEIQRIQKEIFKNSKDDKKIKHPKNNVVGDEKTFNYPVDNNKGLVISSDQEKIPRQHSYPYGFGSPPLPTYKIGGGIRSKTSNNILTFEEYNKRKI